MGVTNCRSARAAFGDARDARLYVGHLVFGESGCAAH
jgi:hypothetical protein